MGKTNAPNSKTSIALSLATARTITVLISHESPSNAAFLSLPNWTTIVRTILTLFAAIGISGCRSTPPAGSPIQPNPLGSVVDEANRIQEQNAEEAKFIVYVHEFELNEPKKKIRNPWRDDDREKLGIVQEKRLKFDETRPSGYRLNDYGMEHVRRIASVLLASVDEDSSRHEVIVERSESSKHWDTLHHYPVHFNERLDEERRQVVVVALEILGVEMADSIVKVAPAFPEGLTSIEAAQAYQSTRFGNSGNRGGGGGGF